MCHVKNKSFYKDNSSRNKTLHNKTKQKNNTYS